MGSDPYFSPLHLLHHFSGSVSAPTAAELLRLQKQVLAELTLAGSVTVNIREREFAKDDLLKLMDELKDPERFRWHASIYAHPAALLFFEQPETRPEQAALDAFLRSTRYSPYNDQGQALVSKSLRIHLRRLLALKQYQQYQQALDLGELLDIPARVQAPGLVYQHLQQLSEYVTAYTASYSTDPPKTIAADFVFVISENLPAFLSGLPEEYDEVIAELLDSFCLLVVHFYRYNTTSVLFLRELCDALLQTAQASDEVKNELRHYRNMTVYKPAADLTSSYSPAPSTLGLARRIMESKWTYRTVFSIALILFCCAYLNISHEISTALLQVSIPLFILWFFLWLAHKQTYD